MRDKVNRCLDRTVIWGLDNLALNQVVGGLNPSGRAISFLFIN